MNHRFYWLDQIQAGHRSSVGKNTIYLSRLVQHCSPVQPGFVVPIEAFQRHCQGGLAHNWSSHNWASHSGSIHGGLDQSGLDQSGLGQSGLGQSGSEHSLLDLGVIDQDDVAEHSLLDRSDVINVLMEREKQKSWLSYQGGMQAAIHLQNRICQHSLGTAWQTALQTNVDVLNTEFCLLQAFLDLDDDPDAVELWTPQICPIAEVEEALKRLWAETFCARNLCYWQQHNYLPHTIPLAVLVQPLIVAEASGQLWVNSEIIGIHASWGLSLSSHPWEPPNLVVISDRITGALQSQSSYQQTIFHGIAGQLPVQFASAEPLIIAGQGWLHPHAVPDGVKICLKQTQIDALIEIGQQAWKLLQKPLKLNWLFDGTQIILQSLYATQADEMLSLLDLSKAETTSAMERLAIKSEQIAPSKPLAIGIAAAPGEVTAQAIVLSENQVLLQNLPAHRILVTTHLTPQWLPLIRQAVGIVTEQGGITSHAAILARELGIPAIVGVANATQRLHSGDWLRLKQGKIYPIEAGLADDLKFADQIASSSLLLNESPAIGSSPSQSKPQLKTQLKTHCLAVVSQVEQLTMLSSSNKIDGIGLIRAEHLLLPHLQNKHPWQWLQQSSRKNLRNDLSVALSTQLRQVLSTIAPLPVWYRTADWRSHELSGLMGAEAFLKEQNPILGIHGAASYQQFPEWLDLELNAIAQLPRQALKNIRLLFPFVRTVEEFRFCRSRVEQAGLGQVPLWIMAEVPSVLFALADYVAAGVQGITIGMNDWVQLLFAIDRDHPALSNLFNPNHPAVRQSLQQLIQATHQLNIPCHVCSLTEDETFVSFLVECGVSGIAANVKDIDRLRNSIFQAESQSSNDCQ